MDAWDRQLELLGGFIRQQRRLAHLSLRELATLTSVSNAYLSQVERGLHQPSLKVLRAIADALGVPPVSLLAQAGMVEERAARGPLPASTEQAIHADARLSDAAKESLVAAYRGYLEPGA